MRQTATWVFLFIAESVGLSQLELPPELRHNHAMKMLTVPIRLDFPWPGLCLVGAAYFMYRVPVPGGV